MKRFSTLLVILTLFSSYIHIARASDAAQWMPDANLRTAVRTSLGLADNEDLTQAKMLDLTELKAAGRGISNLTGLEHATNVTIVRLAGNQISNISPLSGLTSVTKLRLQGNEITNIASLSGLTDLTELFLNNNQITDVTPLTNLVNLVKLRLAGNSLTNAHLLSSLTKLTDVDITIPSPPDTEAPGVSISVPSGTQTGAFSVTITFTESVSGFTQSDLSLSGTASASITGWNTTDNTTYTATITPTSSGSVTLNVNAGVATDAANNSNTAATSQTVTVSVDTESPGVTVSVPSGVQNSAFNVTITFTETVSGFTQSEVSLNGSAASITAWSANSNNTIYTATITPTASGTVTIGVAANVATDAANNQNTGATSKNVTVDVDKPTVTIGVPSGVQNSAFNVTITFTEKVSGFTQSEVSLSGSAASITAWSANSNNTIYTATITPTASGTVTIGVAANVATDAANNQNTGATSKNVTVDVDKPTVTIGVPSGVQNSAFNVSITFTEAVSGFTQSDLSVGGTASASVTAWSGTRNTTYTATITSTSSGTVTLNVAAGVATDAANNSNTAATSQTVTVDVDKPGVSISVPSGDQTNAFEATITFTETVSGFEQGDLSISGTANATITAWNTTDDTVYTAKITPATTGTITLSVAAGVATDAASNPNTETSETQTVTAFVTQQQIVDTTSPSVSITVPSGTQNGAFSVTITFTEAVSGFVQSELSLMSNTAGATITAWVASSDNTTYTATITPTTSGTVTLNVAANVATDAANNPNTAATSQTVTVDVDKPSVSITVPSDVQQQGSAFEATITFSEAVSGFEQTDVSLTGTATASITAWVASSDNTTYTATITATITTTTSSGTVTLDVAANVATDAADNPNTAASETVTVNIYWIILIAIFPPAWDVNSDYSVDETDVALVTANLGKSVGDISNTRTDVNGDGVVDNDDLTLVMDNLDTNMAPSSSDLFSLLDKAMLETLDPAILETQLEILRTQSDGSLKYLRAIALLENLLAAIRPDETRLLANYPNPFNPETWIPYHLANDTDVQISIYDINGTLVRRLDLGHQLAGYYTSRNRAAYWDGRNEFGEQIANGIYFYHLQADNMSLLRKMVILK